MVLGGVCIAVAAVLSFFVLPGINKSKENTVIVCKLTANIPAGTRLEGHMLKEVEVGSYGLPGYVIKDPGDIVGKYAKTSMTADDLLFPYRFADFMTDEKIDKILAEGKKLVSISVANNAASVANHIKSGDVVSFICYIDNAAVMYDELMNLEVYSIENQNSVNVDNVNAEKDTDIIAATITVIVNEHQARRLVFAEYSGKIHTVFEQRGTVECVTVK